MITEIRTRTWQQRIHWRSLREKYGCPECGHRSWQRPLQILPRTYKVMPSLVVELLKYSMPPLVMGNLVKRVPIEYVNIISIPRVDVLRYPPTE